MLYLLSALLLRSWRAIETHHERQRNHERFSLHFHNCVLTFRVGPSELLSRAGTGFDGIGGPFGRGTTIMSTIRVFAYAAYKAPPGVL